MGERKVNMDIHSPQNLKLPALKYQKEKDRLLIENDLAVKSLIDSKLLLDKTLNLMLVEFLLKSKDLNQLLEERGDYGATGRYHFMHKRRFAYSSSTYRRYLTAKLSLKKRASGKPKIEKQIEEILKEERKDANKKLKSNLIRISNKLQSNLDSFEKKHNKLKLNILDSVNLYICKNCKKILCLDRFHSMPCECGKNITSVSNCDTAIIHRFGDKITKFVEDNMWLEHGIDYLMRKKGFNTLCGVYILGHSGIEHEIDNVVELNSENLRMFGECKNKDVNVRDVFVFAGKMADIGCTRGYIFTTSFETQKEVKHLARSKNITIIEQVLERDNNKIIKDIKEGVLGE